MEYEQTPSSHIAVQRTPDPFASSGTQFEKTVSHRTGIRHTHFRTELHKHLKNPRIVGKNTDGPRFYLCTDSIIEVFDGISHIRMLSNMRTHVNAE